MNLKDTDIENKRKQAIEALVADSTTLAVAAKPDRFEIALKAVIRRELCDILNKAGEEA
jgi:hypothetical protein